MRHVVDEVRLAACVTSFAAESVHEQNAAGGESAYEQKQHDGAERQNAHRVRAHGRAAVCRCGAEKSPPEWRRKECHGHYGGCVGIVWRGVQYSAVFIADCKRGLISQSLLVGTYGFANFRQILQKTSSQPVRWRVWRTWRARARRWRRTMVETLPFGFRNQGIDIRRCLQLQIVLRLRPVRPPADAEQPDSTCHDE